MMDRTKKETDYLLQWKFYEIVLASRITGKENGRNAYQLQLFHEDVCRTAMLKVLALSVRKYETMLKHVMLHGMKERIHRNVGNHHRSFEYMIRYKEDRIIERAKEFLHNYGERYGMPDPGHIRMKNLSKPLILLPSRMTKMSVFIAYQHALNRTYPGAKSMSLSTFKKVWKKHYGHLKVLTPASDLCLKCINWGREVFKAPTREVREEKTLEWKQHLDEVDLRRLEYTNRNKIGEDEWEKVGGNTDDLFRIPRKPCSLPAKLCYDFDFAANMQLPHHARQENPIYFASPLKVYVFGVAAAFAWKQVFFLLREGDIGGRDANCVISLLDAFFGIYGAGETDVQLHCDNCGQNKNNLLYLGSVKGMHLSLRPVVLFPPC
tara:strand:+ start:1480 stop:2613 length:1134 start_codon:yes stop_codon:yes gene_type:complete